MPDDVHPQIQAMFDMMAELGLPKLQDMTTNAARGLVDQIASARCADYPPPEVAEVVNMSTGAGYNHVPVRLYRTSDREPSPVIVFYHGGGQVVGSLDSYDTAARFLARSCGVTLVSVDYRMAPEHRFPIAVEDAFQAARWVADHAETLRVDPGKMALAGDSAGGNLAAVVALIARNSGDFPVAAQLLVYPLTDWAGGTASFDRYATGYGVLETDTMVWFKDRYLSDPADGDDWRASPLKAPSLAGLPPALVITAQCDVLRDEGRDYADRMKSAGVPVDYVEFPGMVHGFFSYLGHVDDAERAHQKIAEFLDHLWG